MLWLAGRKACHSFHKFWERSQPLAIKTLNDTFSFSHLIFEVFFLKEEDFWWALVDCAILIGPFWQEATAQLAGIGQPQRAITLIQYKPQFSLASAQFESDTESRIQPSLIYFQQQHFPLFQSWLPTSFTQIFRLCSSNSKRPLTISILTRLASQHGPRKMIFVSLSVYPRHRCPHKPENQEYILRDLHPATETSPFIAKNSKHARPSPKITCRKIRTCRGMFLWNCVKAPSISKMCSKPWALQPCEQLLTQPSGIDCQRHRSVTISFYIEC